MIIYMDENLSSALTKALQALEEREKKEVRADVRSTKEEFGVGALDPDLIPKIGANAGIWITRDKRILQRPAELGLILEHKLGVFIIRPGKHCKHWDIVRLIIHSWQDIKTLSQIESKPFCYRVEHTGKINRVSRVKEQEIDAKLTVTQTV